MPCVGGAKYNLMDLRRFATPSRLPWTYNKLPIREVRKVQRKHSHR